MPKFRLPDHSHRVTINGRTGSGKTVFGAWLLSEAANFDEMPWTIIDFKSSPDDVLAQVPATPIDVGDKPPKDPGLYIMHPAPHDPDTLEEWLWRIWRRGNHGLFLDEGYMIPEKRGIASTGGPFKSILTQGRSLSIPAYTLSQRPVDLNRHVFSEADFYAVFHLNHKDDRKRVSDFTPDDVPEWNMDQRLPKYHCRWYDVGNDFSCILTPCPDEKAILRRFHERLSKRKKFL
jgi:hypothetical protein